MAARATNRSRAAIEADILAWMREGWSPRSGSQGCPERESTAGEVRFDALARELFSFQFRHCSAYRRFCRGRGTTPDSVEHWSQIPAVPTGAFKEVALRCFPVERECKIFRTSGTAASRRGELHLDTLELYETSLLPALHQFMFPDMRHPTSRQKGPRMTIRALAPSPGEAPDSSLSHMLGCAIHAFGDNDSGFDVAKGALDVIGLCERLAASRRAGRPVALCGTAFAFVHLLEALQIETVDATALTLAPGSRVMETGGFKGRSREMPREAFYAALESSLGLPRSHIVNQYGMTELGSQFYDSSLRDALAGVGSGPRRKLGPPWTRVRLVHPETGREVEPGAPGVIAVHDLANTGSVAAVETADLGRRIPASTASEEEGFEVLGREPGAEERGCSIAADAMLSEPTPQEPPWGP